MRRHLVVYLCTKLNYFSSSYSNTSADERIETQGLVTSRISPTFRNGTNNGTINGTIELVDNSIKDSVRKSNGDNDTVSSEDRIDTAV